MNNNTQIPYGNDDIQPIGYNPQITKDYLQQEQSGLTKAVDGSSPAINPQPYCPEGGTILSDEYFNHSNTGVVQVNSYSVNTVEYDEARLREIEQQRVLGRTIYNTPPSVSVMPNVDDGLRVDDNTLALLKERELLRSMNSRLKNLLLDEQNTVAKLSSIRRSIESLKLELENLEEELH